jgi:DNA-binding transcriptional MerR regulator
MGMRNAEADVAAGSGLMHVAEMAERARLSHRTVRYYDDEGLLVAARSAGNQRLYTEADLERLLLIREMKPLGFTLDDMRKLMATLDRLATTGDPALPEDRAALMEFIAQAKHRRDKMAAQLASANVWIAGLEEKAARQAPPTSGPARPEMENAADGATDRP